jgi:hypothetical protein
MPDDVVIKPEPTATPGATVLTAPAADPSTPAAGTPSAGDPAVPKPEGAKKEGAPEKYADFKLPEGLALDPERFGKFQDLAKTMNISQDNAQKLIDLAIANSAQAEKAQADSWAKTREGWVKEINEDPEIGGAKLQESTELARRALKEFANDKLIGFLNSTGFGDHPELVRVFVKIGQKMGEDKAVDGKPSGTSDGKSAAEVLYGNSN